MAVNGFRDLMVWGKAKELAKHAYALTKRLPSHERFALASQVQRAAVSVPANIAEGHARGSTREFLHHLSIARGSLAELETLLVLCEELGYCESREVAELHRLADEISRMLSGMRNSLKRRLQQKS